MKMHIIKTPLQSPDVYLEKITIIREHLNSFPNEPAKAEIENLLGWRGRKEYMNSDLSSSVAENQELVLEPTERKNKIIYLQDNVVNVPKKVKIGEEFEIVSGKLVTTNEYQRLTVQYDSSGAFTWLISEVFRRQD